MTDLTARVPEWHDLDPARFLGDIAGAYRPAVLRGFVRHWPAVQRALRSPEELCHYLLACDSGREVDAVMTPPAERGRLFYNADMSGFNFVRNQVTVSRVVEQLVRYSRFDAPPSVAVQSALVDDCLPRYGQEHAMPALPASARPRLWLGNSIITPAHFDESYNLACVVSGARRFTLFPPEQVANLYIGPLDFAPTPTPISMVDFQRPDRQRHPRFAQAMQAAQVAELGPGDALYIPPLWWHHVQSDGMLNMMVNYWWKGDTEGVQPGSAFGALIQTMGSMHAQPPALRAAWGAIFQHYAFDAAADPGAHRAGQQRDVPGGVGTPPAHR